MAEELFADTQSGRLWLSEEEEEVPELKGWRQKASKPLLHHLMAKSNMTLQQVRATHMHGVSFAGYAIPCCAGV